MKINKSKQISIFIIIILIIVVIVLKVINDKDNKNNPLFSDSLTENNKVDNAEDNKIKVEQKKDKIESIIPKSEDTKNTIYFDVLTGRGCTKEEYEKSWDGKDYSNSYTGYNGIDGIENQNSCLKFYSFNDSGENEKINLLLDHNTTATVLWSSNGKNKNGPSNKDTDILGMLKSDTSSWSETLSVTNYKNFNYEYYIDYSGYRARLITAQEIARITGNSEWDESLESSKYYYFQDLSQNSKTGRGNVCVNSGCTYSWLYDRTHIQCTEYGCLNNSDKEVSGYWTSSAYANISGYALGVCYYGAWYVHHRGYIRDGRVDDLNTAGIRPVIEVYKSNI